MSGIINVYAQMIQTHKVIKFNEALPQSKKNT